jgi:hypothetical protein
MNIHISGLKPSEKQLNLNVITSVHYLLRRSGQFHDVIQRSGA